MSDTDCVSLLADLDAGKDVGSEAAATIRALIRERDAGRFPDETPHATRAMTARVVAERVRQQTDEGYSPDSDKHRPAGELASAAACYALSAARDDQRRITAVWPWSWDCFKPRDPMRDLERAGALILAEMERLTRG